MKKEYKDFGGITDEVIETSEYESEALLLEAYARIAPTYSMGDCPGGDASFGIGDAC